MIERYSRSPRALALAAIIVGILAALWHYAPHASYHVGADWASPACRIPPLFGDPLFTPPPGCPPPMLVSAAHDVWLAPSWSDITFGIIVAVITYAAIVLLILSVRAIQKP